MRERGSFYEFHLSKLIEEKSSLEINHLSLLGITRDNTHMCLLHFLDISKLAIKSGGKRKRTCKKRMKMGDGISGVRIYGMEHLARRCSTSSVCYLSRFLWVAIISVLEPFSHALSSRAKASLSFSLSLSPPRLST